MGLTPTETGEVEKSEKGILRTKVTCPALLESPGDILSLGWSGSPRKELRMQDLRREVSSGEKHLCWNHTMPPRSLHWEYPGVGEGALGTGAQKGLPVEGKQEETVVARGERTSWCEASQSSISVSNRQGQTPWKGQDRWELKWTLGIQQPGGDCGENNLSRLVGIEGRPRRKEGWLRGQTSSPWHFYLELQ